MIKKMLLFLLVCMLFVVSFIPIQKVNAKQLNLPFSSFEYGSIVYNNLSFSDYDYLARSNSGNNMFSVNIDFYDYMELFNDKSYYNVFSAIYEADSSLKSSDDYLIPDSKIGTYNDPIMVYSFRFQNDMPFGLYFSQKNHNDEIVNTTVFNYDINSYYSFRLDYEIESDLIFWESELFGYEYLSYRVRIWFYDRFGGYLDDYYLTLPTLWGSSETFGVYLPEINNDIMYQLGVKDGYDSGLTDGKLMTYDLGFDTARSTFGIMIDGVWQTASVYGFSEYNRGLTETLNDDIFGIFTALILHIGLIFGIEIFPGVSIGLLFAIPFVFAIYSWFMKKVL